MTPIFWGPPSQWALSGRRIFGRENDIASRYRCAVGLRKLCTEPRNLAAGYRGGLLSDETEFDCEPDRFGTRVDVQFGVDVLDMSLGGAR